MSAAYAAAMPSQLRASAFALLPALLVPALTGCAIGAYISPMTAWERAVAGTYEGIGVGGTGRVPYRLVLNVQQRGGKVSGVLTNLESQKAYALSGTLETLKGEEPTDEVRLDGNLYESGDKHRGTLRGTLSPKAFKGTLRTVLLGKELLGYELEMTKVDGK